MHPQGKYNALLPPPFSSFSLFLTFSLLSPFSSATKGGFVARRSSTKPYTLSTTVLSITATITAIDASPSFQNVINACVNVRFVNDVTPFCERHCRRDGFRISSILCHRSARKAKRKFKGNLSVVSYLFTRNPPGYKCAIFLFLSSRIISRSFIINLSSNLIR